MNKQQSKKMASLRKKLFAAIAMLLVACIMAVSSTYAWFTLSTAPEVKGISTTIGANGNLEMALVRIENKTYGICKITGKLIPKERLLRVPHATECIEAKEARK